MDVEYSEIIRKEELEKRQRAEWLAGLKPGDEVAVPRRAWASSAAWEILAVERVTATQIIIGRARYRRDSGLVIGSGYGHLAAVTAEIRESIERAELRSWLERVLDDDRNKKAPLTLAQLRAMRAALDEAAS